MAAGDDFAAPAHQKPDAPMQETGAPWTTYLLHFDRPYKHARHYTGIPESSRFLKAAGPLCSGEFGELAAWASCECSACWRADSQPVAVGVTEPDLRSPGHLLDSGAEFRRNRFQVAQTQVDQGVRAGVAGVLGQEQPCRAPCDRHERREAGLEAVFPLLGEPQTLVPGGGCGSVADPKDRDHFLVHGPTLSLTRLAAGAAGLGSVRCGGRRDLVEFGAVADGGGVADPEQAGELERVAAPRLQESRTRLAIAEDCIGILTPIQGSASDTSAPLPYHLTCDKGRRAPARTRRICRQIQQTAADLQARLADHQAGRGARLLQVVKAAGISWALARTWPGGRQRERQLKTQGGASRRCPLCGVEPRTIPAQKEEKTTMKDPPHRSAIAAGETGRRRPDYVIETWVSEQLRDRVQRSGPSLDEALRTTNRRERESEPDLEPEP